MLASLALCHKKGRRQGHCVCSMVFVWFCSFFPQCLAMRGQGLTSLSGFSLFLCVVKGTHLQTERHVIVCLFFLKKKK